MFRLTRKRSLAVVGVAALAAAGIAYASIPDSNNRINACYKTSNGALRVVDTAAGGSCNGSETALAWDAVGARATQISRLASPSSVPTGPEHVSIVAANLPAGFYTVTAHTTMFSPPDAETSCLLTFRAPAAASEIEVDMSEEANVGGAQSIAKHVLDGVWQFGDTPMTVRLRCRSGSTWSAIDSAITATRLTKASIVGVSTGDPIDVS